MITKDRRTDNISQIIPFTAIGLAQALGYELGTHQEIDWEEEVESLKHVHMPRYFCQSTTVEPAYCWGFIPSVKTCYLTMDSFKDVESVAKKDLE